MASRLMAWRDATAVRLLTRNGHDWTDRFPLVREAVAALHVRSCAIDGEAIAFAEDGLASFELLRGRCHDRRVTLCAFDLIELDGEDLQRNPIEQRKAALGKLLRQPMLGLVLNATFDQPGDVVFKQAYALGRESIEADRLERPGS